MGFRCFEMCLLISVSTYCDSVIFVVDRNCTYVLIDTKMVEWKAWIDSLEQPAKKKLLLSLTPNEKVKQIKYRINNIKYRNRNHKNILNPSLGHKKS